MRVFFISHDFSVLLTHASFFIAIFLMKLSFYQNSNYNILMSSLIGEMTIVHIFKEDQMPWMRWEL